MPGISLPKRLGSRHSGEEVAPLLHDPSTPPESPTTVSPGLHFNTVPSPNTDLHAILRKTSIGPSIPTEYLPPVPSSPLDPSPTKLAAADAEHEGPDKLESHSTEHSLLVGGGSGSTALGGVGIDAFGLKKCSKTQLDPRTAPANTQEPTTAPSSWRRLLLQPRGRLLPPYFGRGETAVQESETEDAWLRMLRCEHGRAECGRDGEDRVSEEVDGD